MERCELLQVLIHVLLLELFQQRQQAVIVRRCLRELNCGISLAVQRPQCSKISVIRYVHEIYAILYWRCISIFRMLQPGTKSAMMDNGPIPVSVPISLLLQSTLFVLGPIQ